MIPLTAFCVNTMLQVDGSRSAQHSSAGWGTYWTEINCGGDINVKAYTYRRKAVLWILSWIFIFASFGILRLIFYWRPEWWAWLTHATCDLDSADCIIFRDDHDQWFVHKIHTCCVEEVRTQPWLTSDKEGLLLDDPDSCGATPIIDCFSFPRGAGSFESIRQYRCFEHQKLIYVWCPLNRTFTILKCWDDRTSCAFFHKCKSLSLEDVLQRRAVVGLNEIVVRLKPVINLLFVEVLSPFYMFQLFSMILWYNDNYWHYASCVVLMSIFSITLDVYQTRKNQRALRDTVTTHDIVAVEREGKSMMLFSAALVPGDIILIPSHGCVLQCDAVLVTGSCVVNESMLTGESIPVTKTPIPFEKTEYTMKEHAKHTLFCGTKVMQTRNGQTEICKAVVIRTGFTTAKGQLVRSILYPKPADFAFARDLLKMVGFLAIIAAAGFIYTIVLMDRRNYDWQDIVLRSLDIITIVVPPALPAAMTISVMLAQDRLKKQHIYCISPSVINTCGGIDLVVFDKTGTLTEEGLDFHCAVPVITNGRVSFGTELHRIDGMKEQFLLIHAMAVCHSLTKVEGDLVGDPLDMICFGATGWSIVDSGIIQSADISSLIDSYDSALDIRSIQYDVVRQFPFASNLQRMSVLVSSNKGGGELVLFCKGAPETIIKLVNQDSLPLNFHSVLHRYTSQGYRVLALAHRRLDLPISDAVRTVLRHEVERDLEFIGLVVLENRLKPQSAPVMFQLTEANIRCVMATGDNLLTATHVARNCGLTSPRQQLFTLEAQVKPNTLDGELVLSVRPVDALLNTTDMSLIDSSRGSMSDFESQADAQDLEAAAAAVSIREHVRCEDASLSTLQLQYQLAVTGQTYELLCKYLPAAIPRLVCCTAIFARMSPEHKAQLVGHLQQCGYIVAMCGDGSNDCGALKAAHAGISLSEAEASIASPFTSKRANIKCVPTVIREGRAALVTSFGVFKYMTGYSLCQFLSVCLLDALGSNLSDMEYLYFDLFLITTIAVLFGYTDAAQRLSRLRPPTRILSVTTVLSVLMQLLIVGAFQGFIFVFVTYQPWYFPFTRPSSDDNVHSSQTTCLFLLSSYQYIGLAVVCSKSYPHRKGILTGNRLLAASLILLTAATVFITLSPSSWIVNLMQLKMPPSMKFRSFILLLAMLNFLVLYAVEYFIIDLCLERKYSARDPTKDTLEGKSYEHILAEIAHDPRWIERMVDAVQQDNGVADVGANRLDGDSSEVVHGNNGYVRLDNSEIDRVPLAISAEQ